MPSEPRRRLRRPQRGSARSLGRTMRLIGRDLLRGVFRGRGVTRSAAGIATSAQDRRAEIARVGAAAGVRIGAARLRTVGASQERKREAVQRSVLRSTEDVVQVMGNMKGASMKLAQLASFMVDGLPPGVQEQLASLQQAAPPMSFELVRQVVEAELGSPPDRAFASFEDEPMAAASIGQVHGARTHDGRDVAVKVQYPGVDEAVRADMANLDLMYSLGAQMFGGFDPKELVHEYVSRMTEEFDYAVEADSQRYFADRYRGHAFVRIPEVVVELSARRVLTSEYVPGRRFYDVLDEPPEVRDRIGEIIYRFAYESVLVGGVFSGDPHPGNYIVCDDGRVCFLDFGLVKRFSRSELDAVREQAQAILDGDRDRLAASLRRIGVIREGTEVAVDNLWTFFGALYGSIAVDAPVRFSRGMVNEVLATVSTSDPAIGNVGEQLHFPAALAIYSRYTLGTTAVLGHLQAAANWHRIVRELVSGDEPSTEIGRRWSLSATTG